MKKLKKFAALLLVGVMALALLTACGGGGDGMVTDKDEENKVKSRISQDHGNIAVTNDEGLRAIAEGHLNMDRKNLDAYLYGEHGNYGFKNNVHMDWVDGKLTFTVVVKYDYNNTKLQDIIDSITNNYPNNSVDFKQSSKWTRVGVVAKTRADRLTLLCRCRWASSLDLRG